MLYYIQFNHHAKPMLERNFKVSILVQIWHSTCYYTTTDVTYLSLFEKTKFFKIRNHIYNK